jgi:hypothetical protein
VAAGPFVGVGLGVVPGSGGLGEGDAGAPGGPLDTVSAQPAARTTSAIARTTAPLRLPWARDRAAIVFFLTDRAGSSPRH